jgi:hypothetical protein
VISVDSAERRYVRSDSDLPDHDLILELSDQPSSLACHARHYVHNDVDVVVVGQLNGGLCPIANAASVAREVAETVIPPGGEFTMIAYTPRSPLSSEPRFREVTFELDGCRLRPSSKAFDNSKVALACFSPVDLAAVEALTGRPVLMFPYGFYTRALAEAVSGQPAKRLLDLLIETGLACPTHGPSPYGEYCGFDPSCEEEPNRRARMWRARFAPRRRSTDGAYVGVSTDRSARVELALERGRQPIPVFGLAAPEAGWGYGGSGPQEGATSILADYLGFLPRPQLCARFEREVVSNLAADAFTLPISELDAWFEHANRAVHRGLVVVAGPANGDWPAGIANGMAAWIAQGLLEAGFDVYEPGCNAVAPPWTKADRRLHGMLHASLLSALDGCSMVVVPYDGEAIMQGVEAAAALQYILENPDVPAVIAYNRAEASDFERHEGFGVQIAKVGDCLPRDVSAVIAAVDRSCAAYECLQADETRSLAGFAEGTSCHIQSR